MKIKFPTSYQITYPEENKKYFEGKSKKEISELLAKISAGYCMYCGRKVIIDDENFYQVEHSIEQKGYIDVDKKGIPFTHCKFNHALACMKCNQKYKNRMIERLPFELVGKKTDCESQKCRKACEVYLSARQQYIDKNKIILQPVGVKGQNLIELGIQYDLIRQIFIPVLSEGILPTEIELIQEHIARFNLNGNAAISSIIKACELVHKIIVVFGDTCSVNDIINILDGIPFEHILVKELMKFITSTIKEVELLKDFCELYIVLSYI